MSGYPRQEVAQRAGVDPGYVDRLVEVGILTPGPGDTFSQGDVLRARGLQGLERTGVPLEGMATAVRDGTLSFAFLDVPAFDRFAGLSATTFQELSASTGIPLELLAVVREAAGFAEPGPEDHVHQYELSVVPLIQLQLSDGFRPVVIERWLRVYGDGLRRIAETETAAIIMISVFGSFILNGDPTIKQFGVGLSVAVLLASAMVLSLAPALLTLFGAGVWWLPRWLARVLPHVDIEGEAAPPTPVPEHRRGAAGPAVRVSGPPSGTGPPGRTGPGAG